MFLYLIDVVRLIYLHEPFVITVGLRETSRYIRIGLSEFLFLVLCHMLCFTVLRKPGDCCIFMIYPVYVILVKSSARLKVFTS